MNTHEFNNLKLSITDDLLIRQLGLHDYPTSRVYVKFRYSCVSLSTDINGSLILIKFSKQTDYVRCLRQRKHRLGWVTLRAQPVDWIYCIRFIHDLHQRFYGKGLYCCIVLLRTTILCVQQSVKRDWLVEAKNNHDQPIKFMQVLCLLRQKGSLKIF